MKMKLKHALLITLSCLGGTWAWGQEFKKDSRSVDEKQNKYSMDRQGGLSNTQLLMALELSGVHVFHFPMKPFDKEYKMHIYVREYVNGERVDRGGLDGSLCHSQIHDEQGQYNTYIYKVYDSLKGTVQYKDFVESITCYTKEAVFPDSMTLLRIETYNHTIVLLLRHQQLHEHQYYEWRRYSQTDWELNKEIPLLVYAISWYDAGLQMFRMLRREDLSYSEHNQQELATWEHYYTISYKIFE